MRKTDNSGRCIPPRSLSRTLASLILSLTALFCVSSDIALESFLINSGSLYHSSTETRKIEFGEQIGFDRHNHTKILPWRYVRRK